MLAIFSVLLFPAALLLSAVALLFAFLLFHVVLVCKH
jgi:hypothetical protein